MNTFIKKIKTNHEFRTILLTVFSGLFLLMSWFKIVDGLLPFDIAWFTIIISGFPILKGAFIGLFTRFDIKAGVLVSIALIAAIIIGEYFAAGEVAFIMMLGEILEDRTVRKAKESIQKLIKLSPQTATIRTKDGEKEIPVEDVKVGMLLLVKPGESIPVDGIITKGATSINQSLITGESMPVDKSLDDLVFTGTINQLGVIEMEATKIGKDTSLAKLIKLVKESEDKKAPIQRLSDRWATIIVPLALMFAIIVYAVTKDVTRSVTILVVFCPCALVLATPTAIIAGIGNASKKGILIKSGEALEKVSKITTIAFDKTGTITTGKPEVTSIVTLSKKITKLEFLKIAATAEKFSEHPLAKAIVKEAYSKGLSLNDPDLFVISIGKGIKAQVDDDIISIGNAKLMSDTNVSISNTALKSIKDTEDLGHTVMMIAKNDELIGYISVSDQLKPNSAQGINKLKKLGINDILLLTGDNEYTAQSIGKQVGISQIHSELLPEEKLEIIKSYIGTDKKICMVGDGINDAPALAMADVSISMGALGSDIAIETADIALMSDDLSKLSELVLLSRKVIKMITANVFISMGINLIAIILAALGIMGPIAGALVHNVGSVLVVLNSSTLIKYRINNK